MSAVEATYTVGDLYSVTIRSWRHILLRILISMGIMGLVFLAIPIVVDGATLRQSASWFPLELVLGLSAFLLLFIVGICPSIFYIRMRRQGLLGPNRTSFSDEGVKVESTKAQSLVFWPAFNRIAVTKARLFMFTTPASAIILPKRAFQGEAEFEEWVDQAQRR